MSYHNNRPRQIQEKIPNGIKKWFNQLAREGKLKPGQSLDDFINKIKSGVKLTEFQRTELSKLLGKSIQKGHIIQLQPMENNPMGGSNSGANTIPEFGSNDSTNMISGGNQSKGSKGINSIDLESAVRSGIPVDWYDEASNYLAGDGNYSTRTVVDKILVNKGVNPDLLDARRDKINQLKSQGANVKETSMLEALHTTEKPRIKINPDVTPFNPRPGGKRLLKIVGDAYKDLPKPLRKGLKILPFPIVGSALSTGQALAADKRAKENPTFLNKTQAVLEKLSATGEGLSLASTLALGPSAGSSSPGIIAGETLGGVTGAASLLIDGVRGFKPNKKMSKEERKRAVERLKFIK